MKNSKTANHKSSAQLADGRQDSDFLARRRVVRGLASVPVILTLGNGAAQANASSHQCLTNAPTEPPCQPRDNANKPTGGDLQNWEWEAVTTELDGTVHNWWCVSYGFEDPPGVLMPSGYSSSTIDQNGIPVPDAPTSGNPLLISCLTSFTG